MKTHILKENGKPVFAVIPYNEYIDLLKYKEKKNALIPNEVVERMVMDGKTIIKAWREYKKYSQKEIADALGITQAAYSQMESKNSNLRKSTLEKIAKALDVDFDQIHDIE